MALDYFPHNWLSDVEMTTYYMTDVAKSGYTTEESRSSLWPWPRRRITLRWTGITRSEATRISMALIRITQENYSIPIYQDQAEVSSLGATGTRINLRTGEGLYRRFGRKFTLTGFSTRYSKLLIVARAPNGRWQNPQVLEIDTVTADYIDVRVAMTGSYAEGAFVYPLMDVEIELRPEFDHYNYDKGELKHTFVERLDTGIPGSVHEAPPSETMDDPTQLNGGLVFASGSTPTLLMRHNYLVDFKTRFARVGAVYEQGRDDRRTVVQGTRARYEFEYTGHFLQNERDKWFSLLKLFDSRRGRCSPLYAVSAATYMEIVSIPGAGQAIMVDPGCDIDDFFAALPAGTSSALVAVLRDGTIKAMSGIISYLDNGDGTWTFNTSPTNFFSGLTVDNVERFAHSILGRFKEDSLTERWKNNEVVEVKFAVTEVA